MAILKENYLRNLAQSKVKSDSRYFSQSNESIQKSLILDSINNFSSYSKYDIFLSHSYLDKELILGLSIEFENMGYSVYVDWIEDNQLDRSRVTRENVRQIRTRMKSAKSLIYATSDNSNSSKWMPWELGFMDGYKDRVVISPITNTSTSIYHGSEYLGIYPYLDKTKVSNQDQEVLWVTDQENSKLYSKFDEWLLSGALNIHP